MPKSCSFTVAVFISLLLLATIATSQQQDSNSVRAYIRFINTQSETLHVCWRSNSSQSSLITRTQIKGQSVSPFVKISGQNLSVVTSGFSQNQSCSESDLIHSISVKNNTILSLAPNATVLVEDIVEPASQQTPINFVNFASMPIYDVFVNSSTDGKSYSLDFKEEPIQVGSGTAYQDFESGDGENFIFRFVFTGENQTDSVFLVTSFIFPQRLSSVILFQPEKGGVSFFVSFDYLESPSSALYTAISIISILLTTFSLAVIVWYVVKNWKAASHLATMKLEPLDEL